MTRTLEGIMSPEKTNAHTEHDKSEDRRRAQATAEWAMPRHGGLGRNQGWMRSAKCRGAVGPWGLRRGHAAAPSGVRRRLLVRSVRSARRPPGWGCPRPLSAPLRLEQGVRVTRPTGRATTSRSRT